jgi:hypothetical protein
MARVVTINGEELHDFAMQIESLYNGNEVLRMRPTIDRDAYQTLASQVIEVYQTTCPKHVIEPNAMWELIACFIADREDT